MQTITTTELRTKSSALVEALNYGKSIRLVHRSKTIAKIEPVKEEAKRFDQTKFDQIAKRLSIEYSTPQEVDKKYRKTMVKKHGKYIL